MMRVYSLSAAVQVISDNVRDVLQGEVCEAVKEKMKETIESTVYDVYSPTVYGRRGGGSGLSADENIVGEVNGERLKVKNVTAPNPFARDGATTDKNLPSTIEYGMESNYDYAGDYGFEQPRPFVGNTREALADGKQHVTALKAGLVKRGLEVR